VQPGAGLHRHGTARSDQGGDGVGDNCDAAFAVRGLLDDDDPHAPTVSQKVSESV
jgi:hypothetical protein